MTSRPRAGPVAATFDFVFVDLLDDFVAARRDGADDDSGMMR
jgi:hypothetical protein